MTPFLLPYLFLGDCSFSMSGKVCRDLQKTKPLAKEIEPDHEFYLKRAQERREKRALKKLR